MRVKNNNKSYKFIFSLGILLLVGYLLICSVSSYLKTEQVKAETKTIKLEIEKEQKEKEEMENVLKENNIDEYLEKRAREDFGYVMPDEKVFYVID